MADKAKEPEKKERTKEDQEREMQANIDLIRKAARG